MIEYLIFLEISLGSYAAAAKHLGYSVRQYYNLRRSILKGTALKPRVKTLIIDKASRLKLKDIKEPHFMDKRTVPPLGRNAGRIEFIAAQIKIQALYEAGYDRKKIHAKLVEEGLISMSYATFCVQFKKFNAGELAPGRPSGAARPEQSRLNFPKPGQTEASGRPKGRVAKTEPFSIDKSKSLEDLV